MDIESNAVVVGGKQMGLRGRRPHIQFDFRWLAHSLYDPTNQCHPNKFNLKIKVHLEGIG